MIDSLYGIIDRKIICNTCDGDNTFKTRGSIIERIGNGDPYIIDLNEDKIRICEHCGEELNG